MKILLLEDSRTEGKKIKKVLEEMEYEVDWVEDSDKALKFLDAEDIDICIFDILLKGEKIDGIDVAQKFLRKNIPVLLVTNLANEERYSKRAKKIGIPYQFFIDKRKTENLEWFGEAIEDALINWEFPKPTHFEYLNNASRKVGFLVSRKGDGERRYKFFKKDEILYLQARGDKTEIYLDDDAERPIVVGRNLKKVGGKINRVFYNIVRVDRSFFINLEQIGGLEGENLYFISDLSEKRYIRLSKAAKGYLTKNGLLITTD